MTNRAARVTPAGGYHISDGRRAAPVPRCCGLCIQTSRVAQTTVSNLLLLHPCCKVCYHSHGLADLLRDVVEKDFLSAGADIVEDLRR